LYGFNKIHIVEVKNCDFAQVYKEHVNGLLVNFNDKKKTIITDYFNLNSFNKIMENINIIKDLKSVTLVIFNFLRSKGINTLKMNEFYQNIKDENDMFYKELNRLIEVLYFKEELFPECEICKEKKIKDSKITVFCKKCFTTHYDSSSYYCPSGGGGHSFNCYHCPYKEFEIC